MKKLCTPWDLNENSATKFAHNDKIEKQLLKKSIAAQPLVHLALVKSAFLATGKYDITICALESKPSADQTFDNFCLFVIAEYSKHYKNDKTKAKSVGFSIANQAIQLEHKLTTGEACEAECASHKRQEDGSIHGLHEGHDETNCGGK